MRHAVIRVLSGVLICAPLYTFSSSVARTDDWGCQVLLCLSNPGSPTEYAECRSPIERLWSHLAKGRTFPICSGIGFTTSRPRYEPYYCDTGFRLVTRSDVRGHSEAGCVSIEPKVVSKHMCRSDYSSVATGQWYFENSKRVCKAFVAKRPNIRKQPRYVDVTIDGAGRQRVWF
ncbi:MULTISPECIES: hypothetical protein [Brucella]|jgi:hypothetical protein|uniref:Uncharacterized protein n=1 Tax=Brucella pseudogrignonensis TaxID=419475 RepID=A0A7Y3T9D9_9HYPH|nr:hypothetical protein [Brucella pseudogrignonensis]MQP40492.1 hypothetical protein [Ochrobactrum sp. MYb237]NNV23228.1 hypothetical protein [Brucella pseudogrignonensis]PQZ38883.1 hypothetical protein CQ059_19700 [Brucella pseudogrignonensis]PRA40933.1 hypothetical protein CQ063_10360 [Brucella pseudogrignonensis]